MRTFGSEDISSRETNFVTLKDGIQRFRVIPVPTGNIVNGKPEMAVAYEKADLFWADSLDEKGNAMRRPVVTKAERVVDGKVVIDKFTQEDAATILLPTGVFLSAHYKPKTSYRTLVWDYQLNKLLILPGPAWNVFERLGQFAKTQGPLTTYDIVIQQVTEGGYPKRQTDIHIPSIGKPIPEDVKEMMKVEIASKRDDLMREMVWSIATPEEVAKTLNGQVIRDPNERMRLATSLIPEGTKDDYVDPFEGGAGQSTGVTAPENNALGTDDDLDFG